MSVCRDSSLWLPPQAVQITGDHNSASERITTTGTEDLFCVTLSLPLLPEVAVRGCVHALWHVSNIGHCVRKYEAWWGSHMHGVHATRHVSV